MKIEFFEGKNKESILQDALDKLDLKQEDVIYSISDEKGGLFKSQTFKLKLVSNENIKNYLVDYLKELTVNMGLDCKFESKIREGRITINMYSDNNSILIGKNGKTLTSIQTILRQLVFNEMNSYPNIILDVENYKENIQKNLEKTVKHIAKEVQKTKIDVTLDSMNSYERRIVHNILNNFDNITTVSEGEEPNRCVVVKYKE